MIDLEIFQINLNDTLQYCSQQNLESVDPEFVFRKLAWPPMYPNDFSIHKLLGDYPALFDFAEHVFSERHIYLANKAEIKIDADQWNTGRLLLSLAAFSDLGGDAKEHSNHFLDLVDSPPWDIWLYIGNLQYSSGNYQIEVPYILSWIPAQFIGLVDEGIEYCPMEYLTWLDDIPKRFIQHYDLSFLQALKDAGYITP